MSRSILDEARFQDEEAAYAYVEAEVWPNGRVCPHCGVVDRSGTLKGKSTRIGLYKCYACRKPFTVKVGTIFEKSHVPLHLWLQTMHLLSSSKKGISSNQLHRLLGVDLKTAWFMSHRIRLAMDESGAGPLGGAGAIIESDETFIGYKEGGPTWEFHNEAGWQRKRGWGDRNAVLTVVERKGRARSVKLDGTKASDIRRAVLNNSDTKSTLMTDELRAYTNIGKSFAAHEAVNHSSSEWVRGIAHTNPDSPDGFAVF